MSHENSNRAAVPPTVPRPAGLEQFMELATTLYGLPDCDTGGPLHVELDDHATELLVGDKARKNMSRYAEALTMIETGQAPAAKPAWSPTPTDDEWIRTNAHWYCDNPAALRTAIALLDITKEWTEDQASAAYATWARDTQGGACDCEIYPVFETPPERSSTPLPARSSSRNER